VIVRHYTKAPHLFAILGSDTILPAPPLEAYDLSRQAVEANPGSWGFASGVRWGRRFYQRHDVPHPGVEGALATVFGADKSNKYVMQAIENLKDDGILTVVEPNKKGKPKMYSLTPVADDGEE
jgi:hypothetical protein